MKANLIKADFMMKNTLRYICATNLFRLLAIALVTIGLSTVEGLAQQSNEQGGGPKVGVLGPAADSIRPYKPAGRDPGSIAHPAIRSLCVPCGPWKSSSNAASPMIPASIRFAMTGMEFRGSRATPRHSRLPRGGSARFPWLPCYCTGIRLHPSAAALIFDYCLTATLLPAYGG